MRKRFIPVLGGLAATVLLLGACGSSSTSPGTSTDLSGSYTLQSLTQSGFTLSPPLATGSLVLTSTNYTLHLVIAVPGQPADTVNDAGTYTTSGTAWTQNSTTLGVQSVGTFSLSNGVLSVNVTTQGQASSSVWKKQ